jgi:hypothetical protein
MRAGTLSVLLVATGVCTHALDDAPPVITVCEALTDLQRYQGKDVIILGKFIHTMEGNWLVAECGFKVKNGGREFGTSISTGYTPDFDPRPKKPQGFRWDEPLLQQKLRQMTNTTKTDQWMAVFGRLETRLPRKLHIVALSGKERDAYTNGFGHLSESPAQLIPARDGSFELKLP